MSTRTTIKGEAADPKEGMTLGEVESLLRAADGMAPDARIKVRVGYSGQIRTMEVIER